MSTKNISRPLSPMSTPAAQAYADEAVRLGESAAIRPASRLNYGPLPEQIMDVYEPEGTLFPSSLPVLVFFHGGAWTHGSLDWLRFMAPAVLANSMVFVGVSYRLAPEHRWPAAFEDACLALEAVYKLVQARGFDASRIVVAGHSAGGHLAALAALRGSFPWLHSCFPVSSRFDLRTENPQPGSGEERVYQLVLASASQDADASPICFVTPKSVPFHIVWGENDFLRVSSSSLDMANTLRDARVPVSTDIVPQADHFAMHLQLGQADNPWYDRLKQELADAD